MYVGFCPKADKRADVLGRPLRAMSDRTHRSKKPLLDRLIGAGVFAALRLSSSKVRRLLLPADRPGLSQSHHIVRFCPDDRIAFAGGVLEPVTVEDFDMPAPILDQRRFLQSMGFDRNAGSPHPEHM
jgi:hypothetical protein